MLNFLFIHYKPRAKKTEKHKDFYTSDCLGVKYNKYSPNKHV
jgi:hypothetical protein